MCGGVSGGSVEGVESVVVRSCDGYFLVFCFPNCEGCAFVDS